VARFDSCSGLYASAVTDDSTRLLAPITVGEHREVGGVEEDVFPVGDAKIKRIVYPPGYRWSENLKPIVGTDLCMHAHVGFLAEGHMRIEYPDGCVIDLTAPQPVVIHPGHDAAVIGDQTAVLIQFDFDRDTVTRLNLPAGHTHAD
jgi:hypothetical protein